MEYTSEMQLPTYRAFSKANMSPEEAEIWLNGLIVLKRTYRGLTRKHLLKVAQNSFAEPLVTWPFQPPQNRDWQQFYKEFKRCFVNCTPTTRLTNPSYIQDPQIRTRPALRTSVTPANPSDAQLSVPPQPVARKGESSHTSSSDLDASVLIDPDLNQPLKRMIQAHSDLRTQIKSPDIKNQSRTHNKDTQTDTDLNTSTLCLTQDSNTQTDPLFSLNVPKPKSFWLIEIHSFDLLNKLVLITRETNTVLNLGGHFLTDLICIPLDQYPDYQVPSGVHLTDIRQIQISAPNETNQNQYSEALSTYRWHHEIHRIDTVNEVVIVTRERNVPTKRSLLFERVQYLPLEQYLDSLHPSESDSMCKIYRFVINSPTLHSRTPIYPSCRATIS